MANEKRTRKDIIDPKLNAAGWTIIPEKKFDLSQPLSFYNNCAIEEYQTSNGPADYALVVDGRILGIVEAKKLSLGPQEDLLQAERYSKGVEDSPFDFRGFRVPFLYSTNGEVIWHHDIRNEMNRSRQISAFHTPSALKEFLDRDFADSCGLLLATPNDNPRLRPYQERANRELEEAISRRKRHMLVAMATGTGKTFTMVNQTYRLMKSGVGKRILFLVDRRALAAQAVRAFASFEAEPGLKFNKAYEIYSQKFKKEDFEEGEAFDPKVLPNSYLTAPKPGHAFVYVSTIQRMTINLFGRASMFPNIDDENEDDANKIDIPIHAFDVIIADECHRGYTSKELAIWRQALDHFDAIKVGLTATPASHTMAYFKEIVSRYSYSQAVQDGYLVDYERVDIHSDIKLKGMFLEEGETVEEVDPETGAKQMDMLEDEREFNATEIEKKATSPDSNRKILEELKKFALEHEGKYHRFPKMLIFAVNDMPHRSHADQLVDMARDVFGRGDTFVQKITGRVDRPLQKIREFRNRLQTGIVVTVDMLTTGVDIPDLEYIVFLRTVKSRILFEQMVGRGTRKGEHFPDKSHFVVFDCFGGSLLEYFKEVTGITKEMPKQESRSIVELIEDIWNNRDKDYNTRVLVKRLHRINKEMSGEARELFAAHGIEDGDLGRFAKELSKRLEDDFTGMMKLLRDSEFQDLLQNYPRLKPSFLVAYGEGATDTVASERVIRGLNGTAYKPGDYLQAFEQFIKENPAHIEAVGILLDRPKNWSTQALTELRDKLKTAKERFTVENLQRAHELHYSKALVDIISMVKHAAREQEPLYTAQERVERAFDLVTKGQAFTVEQQQWLDRIQSHLIENLSIEQEDFDFLPVFSRHGGWSRANKDFDGKLNDLIQAFNEAVAA